MMTDEKSREGGEVIRRAELSPKNDQVRERHERVRRCANHTFTACSHRADFPPFSILNASPRLLE